MAKPLECKCHCHIPADKLCEYMGCGKNWVDPCPKVCIHCQPQPTTTLECKCDFDKWEPEPNGNGHTRVCPLYASQPQPTPDMELEHCSICNSMTNHREGKCLRCAKTTPTTDEWGEFDKRFLRRDLSMDGQSNNIKEWVAVRFLPRSTVREVIEGMIYQKESKGWETKTGLKIDTPSYNLALTEIKNKLGL